MRVLLADDHQILRDGVRRGLESAGATVVGEADNGEEAVALATETSPDIVLMDLSMPVVDGVEATALLRSEFPDARVIVLTGSTDPHLVGAALDAGACGYLMKSASGDDIAEAIRILDRREAVGKVVIKVG